MKTAAHASAAGDFLVRRARLEDLSAVYSLAADEPMAASWPATAYQRFVSTAENGLQACILLVATMQSAGGEGEPIIGFLAASLLPGSPCEIENIVVAPGQRRAGVASHLFESLSLWCRAWAGGHPADLWLEVRAGNAGALAFYQRAGFSVSGRREAYYADGEDALLLAMQLR